MLFQLPGSGDTETKWKYCCMCNRWILCYIMFTYEDFPGMKGLGSSFNVAIGESTLDKPMSPYFLFVFFVDFTKKNRIISQNVSAGANNIAISINGVHFKKGTA